MKEIALQSCSESKGRKGYTIRASHKYNYTKLIIDCVIKNLRKILDSEIIKSNTKDIKKTLNLHTRMLLNKIRKYIPIHEK